MAHLHNAAVKVLTMFTDSMLGLVALVSFVLAACFVTLAFGVMSVTEFAVVLFTVCAALVVASGLIVSQFHALASLHAWVFSGIVLLAIAGAGFWICTRRAILAGKAASARTATWAALRYVLKVRMSTLDGVLVGAVLGTVVCLGAIHLAVVICTAPHNCDSMTYHLPRVAHFLQNGSLDHYTANYWAQVVHPRNSSILMLFSFLVSGRNENLMQIVQFLSYWVSIIAVYGICRRIGNTRLVAALAAGVFGLLTECLMQSVTTQNDMLVTAYVASTVYFLLTYRDTQADRHLLLAASSLGLALGTKSAVLLALPSVSLVALYALLRAGTWRVGLRKGCVLTGFTAMGICAFALWSGYLQNYRVYGSALGPAEVRAAHSFEGKSVRYVFKHGLKNMARFGMEFIALDGLPDSRVLRSVQSALKWLPNALMRLVKVDLDTADDVRASFRGYNAKLCANEDESYWGILGFGLVWLAVGLVFVGAGGLKGERVLALAGIVFFVVQAFAGPYDPWRGRYFMTAAVFTVPMTSALFRRRHVHYVKWYLLAIIALGCLSAWTAVLFRENSPVVGRWWQRSIFSMDRLGQLTRVWADYEKPLRVYERIVPASAVVATVLPGCAYEYPLFGERLTRTVLPSTAFWWEHGRVRPGAEYLVFSDKIIRPSSLDLHLGHDWYLRKYGAGF